MANNTVLASDNFTRANGALGANWTPIGVFAGPQIVSNQAQPGGLGAQYASLWSATTWPNDQGIEVTLGSTFVNESTSFVQLNLRAIPTTATNYEIRIGAGSGDAVVVYRNVAGVQTQIGFNNTVTPAAGDVWSAQVVGPLINIYQNYNRVLYLTDFSVASGSPGFGGYSTTNAAHSAIATWRGYNTVQQDGIWQKQGIVIPLLAADIANSGFGIHDIGQIIYEGNAQLLSGTVYKTWFSGGGTNALNPNSVFYAESLDGISWTRKAATVLLGISCEAVVKSGSTYWLFGQTGTLEGTGPIVVYNSPDGITWTLQNATALAVGLVGAWDAANIYAQSPPVFFNGQWNMLYTGSAANSGALFKMGLATSPDLINWTKYVSNPVLSNSAPGPIVNVNGTFYIWTAAGPSSPQLATGNVNFDPVETVRYQSTNLTTWTNPTRSIHHSQIYEDVNGTTGNATASAIIDIGGKAHMYLVGSPSDSVAPQDYQFSLAVAPAPIASIVAQREDGTAQVATDNFIRSAGTLGANWSTPTGGTALQIISSGLVEATTLNAYNFQYYSGAAFGNDQYSEVTLATLAGANYMLPAVRFQSGAVSGYACQFVGPTGALNTQVVILKFTAGANVAIGPVVKMTPQVGDVLRLSVVGNVISFFQNGAMVLQVEDVNNTYTSGSPAAGFYAGTLAYAQISAWAGGNANVIPSYFDPDDPTLPYIGCVSLAIGDVGGTQFAGHVRVIASPRAGVPNPYLGNMYVATAPPGLDDKLLGEVTVVSVKPAGVQGTDAYLGHIAEE